MAIRARILAVGLLVLLAACGGGGSSGSGAGGGVSGGGGQVVNNAPVIVDSGPAALATGPNGYVAANILYVTVTVCAPGSTSNCQTIDHVQVDTGSVGLRIPASVLNAGLLSALPTQTDSSGSPVGECFGFVDGYTFGSVRSADVQIAGEKVAAMPFQAVADTGVFSTIPSSCSSGGGANLATVQDFGANGILGIGVTTTDCGSTCATTGGYGAAIYYECGAGGCGAIIGRNPAASAPFQQLPNFVAALPTDNNGVLISLPAAAASGTKSVSGTIYFGIGTQANNSLGSATVLTTTTSASVNGAGLITATYGGRTLAQSVIDSGSNGNFFDDATITQCTSPSVTGFYCPSAPLSLSATLTGQNNLTANVPFTVGNAETLFNTNFSALPTLAGTNSSFAASTPNSFDFGLPFFFGRSVFIGIEGRAAGAAAGPFFAF